MTTRVVLMANTIDEVGGAQRVVHVVADGLAARGYPVELVGVAPASPPHDYGLSPAVRRVTLMSRPWPSPPADRGWASRRSRATRERVQERATLRAEAVRRLAEVLADGPPGVVVTSQLWAMEHLAEVPHDGWGVMGQYHSSFEAAAAGRDLPRALRLYRDVDVVTLLTPADAERFRRAGLNNTAWLPNPLALWPDPPVDPATGPPVITYLGRLAVEKGPTFLLDAWALVADRHPQWRLRLVGSGPEERSVRAHAAALPAGADRVDVVGPVTDSEEQLRGSSILALPSLTEGLPLALAEAMAMGLPCVATDCSAGVRLLAGDGRDARLVPRADPGALAAELDQLMGDPAARVALGARARESVRPYRSTAVLDEWETLLAAVLR